MKKYLIVLDLDDTLLRGDKTISDYTKSVLKRCQELGNKIVISTARSYIRTVDFAKQINADYICAFNGNLVCTDNEGFALYFSRSPIPYTYNPEECYRVMGLYGYSSDFLRVFSSFPKSKLENSECGVEMLRVMERGYRIKLLETEYNTIGVDLPEHILQVEKIIRERNCN